MSDTESSRVEAFLADVSKRPAAARQLDFRFGCNGFPRAHVGYRGQTSGPDVSEAAVIGSLDVQLVYFRGMDWLRR